MKRSEVYAIIDNERDYQDEKWIEFDDSEWSINDWLVFIERYINEAKNLTGYPNQMMNSIRKIAALAVVAMENNKTSGRT